MNTPPKVLHIIAGFALEGPLGGIERFGVQLVQAFDKTKIHPIICGLWDYGTAYEREWVTRLREQGIPAFIAAPWQERHPYRAFLHAVHGILSSGYRVDIIHSHQEFGDIAAFLVKYALKATHVVRTVHNEREWVRRPWRRWFLTHGLWVWFFDHEFGVSRQIVANLEARPLARWRGKRSTVAYNSIDLSRFGSSAYTRADLARWWGIPPTAPLLMSIGRLTEQKGYSFLLDAIHRVVQAYPNAHLILVGSGPLEAELRARAARLGLAHCIHFVGVRRDIEQLLPLADVFISSSLWEGLPTVLLEACAAKVPVVATQVSGTVEIIVTGRSGLLVPPGDSGRLAEAIMEMLTQPVKAKRMAQQAYMDVQERFSIEAVARQYESFYIKLLERSKSPAP